MKAENHEKTNIRNYETREKNEKSIADPFSLNRPRNMNLHG